MTDVSRTRIALVGAGRMGQVHLAALQSSEEITVAGVVEPAAAIRAQLEAGGVTVYGSVQDLLDTTPLDAVLIAAPTDQHADLVATFAGAGVPMLCEKPVGVTPEDAERATLAAADAGVLLQVGYWRRFVPELRELRERIAASEHAAAPGVRPRLGRAAGDDLQRCRGDDLTRPAVSALRLVLDRDLGYSRLRAHPVHVGRRR